eukprot:3015210-Pleurochrysis_carterae.AAC.3
MHRRLQRGLLSNLSWNLCYSITKFNTLHHAYTRLGRSLPAHAQLGDALIAEQLCAVVRRDLRICHRSTQTGLPGASS